MKRLLATILAIFILSYGYAWYQSGSPECITGKAYVSFCQNETSKFLEWLENTLTSHSES